MSGDSKGGGQQTATQTVQVPEFLRPFVEQSANVGSRSLASIENLAGNNLVAGFDPTQLESFALQEAIARDDAGALSTAQNALQQTAQGDFLFGGPGFDEAVQAAVRAAQPGILSAFGRAGRANSGLAQTAIAQSASDAFASLFNQERSRQLAAASALPGAALTGANILSSVGQQRQAQTQRELAAPLAQQQQVLSSALGVSPSQSGLFGSTTTQTQPGGSKAGDALGFGLAIAGLPTGGGASLGGGLLSSLF